VSSQPTEYAQKQKKRRGNLIAINNSLIKNP
jgi:hypothetical protein